MVFTQEIVSDVFKSFFLGYIFKNYYLEIGEKLKN